MGTKFTAAQLTRALSTKCAAEDASNTKGYNTIADALAFMQGYLFGLTLANNGSDATNDIDFATGRCVDSTSAVFMNFTSALTKRLDANWAAGTNQGMRNSAAAITDTTYHIYAVCKAAGADPDIYAHTSTTVATVITALQAETGGSAYLYARRIGSIMRASSAIRTFSQLGDEFLLTDPPLDVDVANTLTTAELLSTLSVPAGIKVTALINAMTFDASSGHAVYISSPDVNDEAPSFTAGPGRTLAGYANLVAAQRVSVRTNTSAQIRSRSDLATVDTYRIVTLGWIDTRGRLA
jgi:hypothetical protein